jgi:aryl-alcohol dehydrogenase-like predicted oxidoreductase
MKTPSNIEMPYRPLGRTGEKVSIIGLGGFHLGMPKTDDEAIQIIRTAIDSGINFLDNCWDYNHGISEIRMGNALRDGYRNKAFLMTKIDAHTTQAAVNQLDESLQRLQTDVIDLLQFHEVIRITDPAEIFRSGGSMEAVIAAKKAGKIRYIGFSGHKSPAVHLKMLQTAAENNFQFDAVQMPLNVMDAHYDSFEKQVLPVAVRNNISVLAMKPMGAGSFLKSDAKITPIEYLHYTMSLPVSTVITGCENMALLQQALDAVRSYQPMTEERCAALLAKSAKAAVDGKIERYKTDIVHDGTIKNPHWLG